MTSVSRLRIRHPPFTIGCHYGLMAEPTTTLTAHDTHPLEDGPQGSSLAHPTDTFDVEPYTKARFGWQSNHDKRTSS